MAEMILPHLTENLQNLIDGEKEIQTRSVLFLADRIWVIDRRCQSYHGFLFNSPAVRQFMLV